MSTRTTWTRLVGLLAVVALVLAACGGGREDDDDAGGDGGGEETTETAGGIVDLSECNSADFATGVDDTSVKIGSSFPQSGTFAAFAEISKGYRAYFDYINAEEGGVDGRQIDFVAEDDAYDATRTANNVAQLIQQDEIFALFNVVGTENNLAFWDDTEEECIPNLFAATGSPNWGNPEYQFTIGSLPAYTTETLLYAEYVKENLPGSRVAVLYQNDDFGKTYLDTFKREIEGSDIEVVAEESYARDNTDVAPQVTSIAAEDPDVILLGTTALACPSALNAVNDANLDAQVFVSSTCTSPTLVGLAEPGAAEGAISITAIKDPRDPQWSDDPAMQLYLEKGAEYGNDIDLENTITAYGWTFGVALVEVLKAAVEEGGELNRATVMEAARTIDRDEIGLSLPGVPIRMGEGDKFPSETLQLMQYSEADELWAFLGELQDFEGRTGEVSGF